MSWLNSGPKTEQPKPVLLADLRISTAQSGSTVPKLIGTKIVPVNVVWYGDLSSRRVYATSGK